MRFSWAYALFDEVLNSMSADNCTTVIIFFMMIINQVSE
jgi:hypothetical protein